MASLLGKHKIAVDTASLADGDSIAAYITSASGALIDSATIGGNEHLLTKNPSEYVDNSAHTDGADYLTALAVVDSSGNYQPITLNASGEIPVAASVNMSGDYPEDSAHVSGDAGLFTLSVRRDTRSSGTSADGDYASFNTNSVGELYVKDTDVETALTAANASLDAIEASVASIDVDTSSIITELQAANASLDAIETDVAAIEAELLDQGTTLDSILADTATIDSNIASILSEVQALSFAEDAAHSSGDMGIQALAVRKDAQGSNVSADGDYSSFQTWSEGSLKVVDIANGSMLQQQVNVSSTAAAVPASPLANRKSLMLQNSSSASIWVGSATVTTSGATAGIELPKASFMELEVGPAVPVYAIKSGAGTLTLNVLELA